MSSYIDLKIYTSKIWTQFLLLLSNIDMILWDQSWRQQKKCFAINLIACPYNDSDKKKEIVKKNKPFETMQAATDWNYWFPC